MRGPAATAALIARGVLQNRPLVSLRSRGRSGSEAIKEGHKFVMKAWK